MTLERVLEGIILKKLLRDLVILTLVKFLENIFGFVEEVDLTSDCLAL